ncbi:MAG: LuxR C-terminal-related transcriptional regulator, partial [Devosia sp.]
AEAEACFAPHGFEVVSHETLPSYLDTGLALEDAACIANVTNRQPETLQALLALSRKGSLQPFIIGLVDRTEIGWDREVMAAGAFDVFHGAVQMTQLLPSILHRFAEWGRLATLTVRQRQIASRITYGWTYKEIARDLGLSPRTVEAHLVAVRLKLNCCRSSHVIRHVFALEQDTRIATIGNPP